MKPRPLASSLCLPLGALLLTAGCAVAPQTQTTRQPPKMPSIAPSVAAASVRQSAAELAARAAAQAASDPAGAAAALAAVSDPAERTRHAREIASRLAERDPQQAVQFAAAFPPGLAQNAATEAAAAAFTSRDPEGAIRWALSLSPAAAPIAARQTVAARLIETDPQGAVKRFTAIPAGPDRDELLGYAAASWARRDTDAALAWARDQSDSAVRERLLSSIGFAVAQAHPDRAIAIAGELPPGRNRWLLTSALAQTWVAQDPKAAFAWAQQLPAGEARDSAYAGFDTGLGTSGRRSISGPGTRSGTSRIRGGGTAASSWSEEQSATFAVWLRTQRDGMTRDEAILEYVRQRGSAEPQAVGQLLSTLPGTATRDQAIALQVDSLLSSGSSREAADFLRTLPRSSRTDEMTERIARQYLLTNPGAAAAWLEETTIPPHRKRELLREAGR